MRSCRHTIVPVLAIVAMVAATSVHAATTASGTVDACDGKQVTVGGARYAITRDTELLDKGGHRIPASDLVPGTPVDLEIGDDGDLVAVRATLVR
jgi:hypothetical protein